MLGNRRFTSIRLLLLSACLLLAVAASTFVGWIPRARANSSRQAGNAANTQNAQSAPGSACKGVLSQPDALKKSVLRVPKYQRTYLLVVGGSARNKITGPDSHGLAQLSIEISDDPGAKAIAQDLHLSNVRQIPVTDQSPAQPLLDLSAGKSDAVIMWAPLAGAGMSDLGLEDKVAIFTVDRPKDAPAAFSGHQETEPDPCAAAISDDLDSFGVLPAELLVPVSLRALIGNTPTPVFSMQNAEQGGQAFEQICSRCHGSHAVADRTLAPVDLLVSIRRFQYIGFKYIVLNGRPQKGMPPLRGTVSEDQIAMIFQYLQARSKHQLTASSASAK